MQIHNKTNTDVWKSTLLLSATSGVMALWGYITFSPCCCCRLTANGSRAGLPAHGASRNHSTFCNMSVTQRRPQFIKGLEKSL